MTGTKKAKHGVDQLLKLPATERAAAAAALLQSLEVIRLTVSTDSTNLA